MKQICANRFKIIDNNDVRFKQNDDRNEKRDVKATVKRTNKIKEALELPTIMNVNPRSIYNKAEEFHTFVEEHSIQCIFMSESWERPEHTLDKIIKLTNYTIISNPSQRRGKGGRPALIINKEKYHVKNITQTMITIPWGVEATWAIISPKNITSNSRVQKIALCSFYSKPNSKAKSLLVDHINQAYNIISTKYPKGLHFIIAGDSNDLKLDNILNISPQLSQVVNSPTRLNPPAMLDPIITTLGCYYQTPTIHPPLDPDPFSNGSPSDHLIPVMTPINTINNKSSRSVRKVTFRPLPKSGLKKFESWISNQNWSEVMNAKTPDEKAEMLQNIVKSKLDETCPEKTTKIASDDQPWYTDQLKQLDRRKRREYKKNRRSEKYKALKKLYDTKVATAKKKFKSKMIDDVLTSREREWYSKLKRITNYDQTKSENFQVDEINHMNDEEQVEAIATSFSTISNEYEPINRKEINIPPHNPSTLPQFKPYQIRRHLEKIKANKSTAKGDIPAKIIKEFAQYLCIPVTDIINTSLSCGVWPKIYKQEVITPIPKQFPPETLEMLRPISNLCNLNKIMEKIISELVVDDMKQNLDPSQYGNQKHLSIQHYLVRLLNRILTSVDRNSKGEVNAVICMFVDWKQAYSRQCHTLGVKSFIKNGVRPALIPILISYFEDRQMKVKWRGKISKSRNLPGSGAMGANLGNWEFLSQTNDNADCVPAEDRFKFVDDLSTIEVINLLTIGLSSLYVKNHVPSDLPTHGQYLNNNYTKSQQYLNQINKWTEDHKMIISQKKTKAMIINHTDNYQFSTRLQLKRGNIEIVDKMKILGTIVTNQLTWNENCDFLIKKVNARMALLRGVLKFGAKNEEMVHLWKTFCRSVLEQSCIVWHTSLTQENIHDLERTQKTFAN